MAQAHISTVPVPPLHAGGPFRDGAPQADGLCHCSPQPDSDSWGQCPKCLRLDVRKAFA
jgi:hypothetical protein